MKEIFLGMLVVLVLGGVFLLGAWVGANSVINELTKSLNEILEDKEKKND